MRQLHDFSHIPIIDVSDLVTGAEGRHALAAQIGQACRDSGFFYIVGHGVEQALQARLQDLSRQFFSQDPHLKLGIRMALGGRAWRGGCDSSSVAAQFPFDPEAAQKALDDAGWTMQAQGLYRTQNGRDFIVELVAADAYPYRDVAKNLQKQLAGIGVGVRLRIVPVGQLVTRYLGPRSYQMALANLDNGPDPDQFTFWHSSQKDYPLNFSNLPRQGFIDKDLEDGRASPDRDARIAAYTDLQTLLAGAAPALFLYEPHYEYAVNRRIGGAHFNPVVDAIDRFQYVTDWYLAS